MRDGDAGGSSRSSTDHCLGSDHPPISVAAISPPRRVTNASGIDRDYPDLQLVAKRYGLTLC